MLERDHPFIIGIPTVRRMQATIDLPNNTLEFVVEGKPYETKIMPSRNHIYLTQVKLKLAEKNSLMMNYTMSLLVSRNIRKRGRDLRRKKKLKNFSSKTKITPAIATKATTITISVQKNATLVIVTIPKWTLRNLLYHFRPLGACI